MVVRGGRAIFFCVSLLLSQPAYSSVEPDKVSNSNEPSPAALRAMAVAQCKVTVAKTFGDRLDMTNTCGCMIDSLLQTYSVEDLLTRSPKQRVAIMTPIVQQCVQISPPSVRE